MSGAGSFPLHPPHFWLKTREKKKKKKKTRERKRHVRDGANKHLIPKLSRDQEAQEDGQPSEWLISVWQRLRTVIPGSGKKHGETAVLYTRKYTGHIRTCHNPCP